VPSPLEPGSKIAILTSGGDAPGMNAAVRAVVRVAAAHKMQVFGVKWGYQGLISGEISRLSVRDVDGLSRRGGTILGSSRCLPFQTVEGRAEAAKQLRELEIQGLVVVGGNGSLTGAMVFANELDHTGEPFRIMGIPASIDNDIAYTTLSIGVDTALNTIVDACDRIADTAGAHARTFVVEVMGRDCGYLAMTAAIASEADGVLFGEEQLNAEAAIDKLVRIVGRAYAPDEGKHRLLVLKSEGVAMDSRELKTRLDARLASEGLPVETRVTVLGHVVRGGTPSAFDRVLAGRLSHAAVRAIIRGRTGEMVGWHVLNVPGGPRGTPFDLDPYVSFWPFAPVLEETRKIADGTSELTKWRVRVLREAEPILAA
jgi:6-phosphofructokinase 1